MDRNTVLWNAYMELPGPSAFPLDLFGFERHPLPTGERLERLFFLDPLEGTETSGWGKSYGIN